MSLGKFFLAVAAVVVPLFGYEYYARYQSWERINGIDQTVKLAATVGKTRSAVESDLDRVGIKHTYSANTNAIYGRSTVGRFMFIYSTEYSFVIRFAPDDSVASVDSSVFHEGL